MNEHAPTALSDDELDAVQGGTVTLVHETTHAGSTNPPRTGGTGTPPAPQAPTTRSPPTWGA